jgi:hypothetical protein
VAVAGVGQDGERGRDGLPEVPGCRVAAVPVGGKVAVLREVPWDPEPESGVGLDEIF